MTQTLDRMIGDLAGGILDAASNAPVGLRQIFARLPMEFALRHCSKGAVIAARPPEETQARYLATPLGHFTFTLDIGRSDSHG